MKKYDHPTPILHSMRRIGLIISVAGLIVLLNACVSSQSPPTQAIWAAQAAINQADRARVNEYAAAELLQARDILNRANLAISENKMKRAGQLAKQSQVTAQLALVRAELVKAQVVNAEMAKSITQLAQEIQRNQREKL